MLAVENSLQTEFIFNSNWHKNVEKNVDAVMEKFSIQKVLRLVLLKDKALVIFQE